MCEVRSPWETAPLPPAPPAAGGFVASSCHPLTLWLLLTQAGDAFGAAGTDNGYIWPNGLKKNNNFKITFACFSHQL